MRLALAAAACALALAACASGPTITGDAACKPSKSDHAWIGGAVGAWRHAERDLLKLGPGPDARLIVFDAACDYRGTDGLQWVGVQHHGKIETPGGRSEEVGLASYSSQAPDGSSYMVMALPSVWRAATGKDVEAFLTGVFVHEMTHTRQMPLLGARIRAAAERGDFRRGLSSSVIQDRFAEDAQFAKAIAQEIALLFSALEVDNDAARVRAGEALALIRARREKMFSGETARFAEPEDLFLTLEGVASFAAYAWMTSPTGGKLSRDIALTQLRDKDSVWSQTEGLAILLVVDRLTPNWRTRAFAAQPATALEMLEAAVKP